MARVQLSPRTVADLEGILKFIANRDPILAAITNVREAVQILACHPLVDARYREQGTYPFRHMVWTVRGTETPLVFRAR